VSEKALHGKKKLRTGLKTQTYVFKKRDDSATGIFFSLQKAPQTRAVTLRSDSISKTPHSVFRLL
jgi:hypothetical protein